MFDWLHDHRLQSAVSAPAGVPGPARRAPSGAPDRPGRHWSGRAPGLVLLAATLGLLLFLGWVLVRGASDLTEEAKATDLCGSSRCGSAVVGVEPPLRQPLPREWRWQAKAVDFEHMYRE